MIQTALTSFEGIARRQEVRGEVRGVTVIDDFGHHPTAIRETLALCGIVIRGIGSGRSSSPARTRPGARFSNSSCRKPSAGGRRFHFRNRGPRANPGGERLDPEAVVAAIAAAGRPAFYEPGAAAIIERIVPLFQPNDVVAIFSNGGFDGIHGKCSSGCAADSGCERTRPQLVFKIRRSDGWGGGGEGHDV